MYSAKSSIEEQGVNTLFLALGKLEWRDPADQEVPRYAPLILVPVEINRENARAGFKLKYNDEDVIPNISLVRFLSQSFGVDIKEFSEEDDLDVAAYFGMVAEEVSNQEGWAVHEDFAALGFFSFSKFLMYRDLDSETWTNHTEILNHEVLNCLLGPAGFSDGPSLFGNSDFVDDLHVEFPPSHVLDADSSQSLVILDVASGRSMVCQGPPGTGKSQSIVNIIAGAIGANKTVLFVSEKKAALDVVKTRIDKLGLGPLCLELPSTLSRTLATTLSTPSCIKLRPACWPSIWLRSWLRRALSSGWKPCVESPLLPECPVLGTGSVTLSSVPASWATGPISSSSAIIFCGQMKL
jgi:hypothetical protein